MSSKVLQAMVLPNLSEPTLPVGPFELNTDKTLKLE